MDPYNILNWHIWRTLSNLESSNTEIEEFLKFLLGRKFEAPLLITTILFYNTINNNTFEFGYKTINLSLLLGWMTPGYK